MKKIKKKNLFGYLAYMIEQFFSGKWPLFETSVILVIVVAGFNGIFYCIYLRFGDSTIFAFNALLVFAVAFSISCYKEIASSVNGFVKSIFFSWRDYGNEVEQNNKMVAREIKEELIRLKRELKSMGVEE